MQQIADDLWQLPLAPRESVNAYLLGDVLVDAGTTMMAKKVLKQVEGRTVAAHTLTHAHPDHCGGSRKVVDALGVPFWAPAGDAETTESGKQILPDTRLTPLLRPMGGFKPLTTARRLQEGDDVGGFTVLDTPGHSPGHISFWRERDRVLVCGDVWFHMLFPRLKPGLREPFAAVTPDIPRNRESMRRLVELEPATVCFGHGPVLRDAAPALRAFTATLPR